jgi:hypothetical protein
MSKNAAEQYCLFSRASFIVHTIRFDLRLSFIRFDLMCLFYCGVPLPEAELMIGLWVFLLSSLYKPVERLNNFIYNIYTEVTL